MKKWIVPLAAVALCICSVLLLSSSACSESPKKNGWSKGRTQTIQCDSTVVERLSKEASSVFFKANKATVYQINSMVNAKDNDKTIGGIKVEKKIGVMKTQELHMLQFLLADSACYSDSPVVPTTPYQPTIAVEVPSENGSVCFLFSFTSQELGVVVNGEARGNYIRYSYARLITRVFEQYIDKEYYKYLMILIK